MIFIGDIALPAGVMPSVDRLDIFASKNVIANLEGAIATDSMVNLKDSKLFSNDNVIDFLKTLNVKGATLANNHITDVPEAFQRTKDLLKKDGIQSCGAGRNPADASLPIVIEEAGIQYVLLAFGWDVIGCNTFKKISVTPPQASYLSERIQPVMMWK